MFYVYIQECSYLSSGAYLYRKERKKSRSGAKYNDRSSTAPSSEDGSCGLSTTMDDEENRITNSSDSESSYEDDIIPIDLTAFLREHLENDHNLIKNCRRLHKLPAQVNVIEILEKYWKHYASEQLHSLLDKPTTKYRQYNYSRNRTSSEDVQRK